jgi:hypothetical protein
MGSPKAYAWSWYEANYALDVLSCRVPFFCSLSASFLQIFACIFMRRLVLTRLNDRGWGEFGRLGHGDTESRFFPEPLAQESLKEVVSVSCGAHHSIAVCADGRLATWGWGCEGQLGTGDTSDQLAPAFIRSIPNHKVSRPIICRACVVPKGVKTKTAMCLAETCTSRVLHPAGVCVMFGHGAGRRCRVRTLPFGGSHKRWMYSCMGQRQLWAAWTWGLL